ncbi:hypothetical protein OF83DRAFT_1137028 [Amylostereum chailletii]|nr:hypothetical protein OF83DRAFT_1137028 [Amylostereum chailletii]
MCWNLATKTIEWNISQPGCGSCALSPDRQVLAVQGIWSGVHLYHTVSQSVLGVITLDKGPKAIQLPVLFIHDGLAFLAGTPVGKVRVWDVDRAGDYSHTLRHGRPLVQTLVAHSDVEQRHFTIATGTSAGLDSAVHVWEAIPVLVPKEQGPSILQKMHLRLDMSPAILILCGLLLSTSIVLILRG